MKAFSRIMEGQFGHSNLSKLNDQMSVLFGNIKWVYMGDLLRYTVTLVDTVKEPMLMCGILLGNVNPCYFIVSR
jgi:hypothetical protein